MGGKYRHDDAGEVNNTSHKKQQQKQENTDYWGTPMGTSVFLGQGQSRLSYQMEEVKHKTKHMRHEMIKNEELTHTYVHVRNTHKTDTGT